LDTSEDDGSIERQLRITTQGNFISFHVFITRVAMCAIVTISNSSA